MTLSMGFAEGLYAITITLHIAQLSWASAEFFQGRAKFSGVGQKHSISPKAEQFRRFSLRCWT